MGVVQGQRQYEQHLPLSVCLSFCLSVPLSRLVYSVQKSFRQVDKSSFGTWVTWLGLARNSNNNSNNPKNSPGLHLACFAVDSPRLASPHLALARLGSPPMLLCLRLGSVRSKVLILNMANVLGACWLSHKMRPCPRAGESSLTFYCNENDIHLSWSSERSVVLIVNGGRWRAERSTWSWQLIAAT